MSAFFLDHVSVIHGATRVLDEISAEIPAGQCTAVIGASGSGKTTLLRLLNRLEEPISGRVLLDGHPLSELDVLGLRRRVALVPQQSVLLTGTGRDEVRVGRPDLEEYHIAEMLERVGLPPLLADRRTAGFSGGEAQRLCLARALAVEPEVLLLDEPTSALDGVNVALIAELARGHVASGGTVVLVSHDLAVVRTLAERVVVLDHGRITGRGRPEEIEYLEAGR
jgi:putative ABC transport system ATP-binding protein